MLDCEIQILYVAYITAVTTRLVSTRGSRIGVIRP